MAAVMVGAGTATVASPSSPDLPAIPRVPARWHEHRAVRATRPRQWNAPMECHDRAELAPSAREEWREEPAPRPTLNRSLSVAVITVRGRSNVSQWNSSAIDINSLNIRNVEPVLMAVRQASPHSASSQLSNVLWITAPV